MYGSVRNRSIFHFTPTVYLIVGGKLPVGVKAVGERTDYAVPYNVHKFSFIPSSLCTCRPPIERAVSAPSVLDNRITDCHEMLWWQIKKSVEPFHLLLRSDSFSDHFT
jgi:hypothetical protein